MVGSWTLVTKPVGSTIMTLSSLSRVAVSWRTGVTDAAGVAVGTAGARVGADGAVQPASKTETNTSHMAILSIADLGIPIDRCLIKRDKEGRRPDKDAGKCTPLDGSLVGPLPRRKAMKL